MRRVAMIYHVEPEGCWAESPDVPGFSAAADTLDEVTQLAREGVEYHLGSPVELDEKFAADASSTFRGFAYAWGWASSGGAKIEQVAKIVTASVGKSTAHVTSAPASRVALKSGDPVATH